MFVYVMCVCMYVYVCVCMYVYGCMDVMYVVCIYVCIIAVFISQGYMVTPRTQESFRRIDKEFDHLLHTNQVPPPSSSSAASVSATVMVSNH